MDKENISTEGNSTQLPVKAGLGDGDITARRFVMRLFRIMLAVVALALAVLMGLRAWELLSKPWDSQTLASGGGGVFLALLAIWFIRSAWRTAFGTTHRRSR